VSPEELLSQLKGIHEPTAIGNWPPAPGWWILSISTLLLIAFIIYMWRRHINNTMWKKEAIKSLNNIDSNNSLHSINTLIKKIAIYKVNDPSITSLSGEPWEHFLTTFLNTTETPDLFSREQLTMLTQGQYQKNTTANSQENSTALIKALQQWIKEA
jgi:uncharacterized protein DUF4381